MKNYTENEIARLQDNLLLIRQAGSWSAEEFGEMIGVSKQTISNLENKKTVMSKTQYIAIRAVLDYEIAERKDDQVLASTVNLCLNKETLSEDDRKKAQAFVSGATKTGLDRTAVVTGLATLVGMTAMELLASPIVMSATSEWIANLLKGKK